MFIEASALILALLAEAPTSNEDLRNGIQHVRDGDFDAAVLTLDAAARRLATEGKPRELAQAYFYFGAAYVGLRQDRLAKTKFEQALSQHPELQVDLREFSERVGRTYLEARREFLANSKAQKDAKQKRGTKGLVLLGAGAAAAAGVAAAATAGGSTPGVAPPTASITVNPAGVALAGITSLTFVGPSTTTGGLAGTTLTWRFGDDGSQQIGSVVNHIFQSPGEFEVTLTAANAGGSATASVRVGVTVLTGEWRPDAEIAGETSYTFQQSGTAVTGYAFFGGASPSPFIARVDAPGGIGWAYNRQVRTGWFCIIDAIGQLDATKNSITGTLACRSCGQPEADVVFCEPRRLPRPVRVSRVTR